MTTQNLSPEERDKLLINMAESFIELAQAIQTLTKTINLLILHVAAQESKIGHA